MLNLSSFYNEDSIDEWFSKDWGRGSSHDYLRERGFTIISHEALISEHASLTAPVDTVDLSYVEAISKPLPEYDTTFMIGYGNELAKKIELDGEKAGEIFTAWMKATDGENKYVVSLVPKSYFVATSKSVEFSDIAKIISNWPIDCCLGFFDDSKKIMLVFNDEFQTVYTSFLPEQKPSNFKLVSDKFDAVIDDGFVKECRGRTGGEHDRIEEFYNEVIKPFISKS